MRDLNKISDEIKQMFKDTFDRKLSLKDFEEKINGFMQESYDEGYDEGKYTESRDNENF